jgi:hypothetical protein
MAFLAKKENNESYTFSNVLKQPDQADFVQAIMKEVSDHKERGHLGLSLGTRNLKR